MASFPLSVAALLLADCRRHCCVCLRWAGQRMVIHHIVPESDDGPGDYDNGIPVCLDCHAEIESKSNMGRKFSHEELKLHRDRWVRTVKEQPDVLVRAAQTLTETGPLEALYAELQFNAVMVCGDVAQEALFAPLAFKQFERAIATNALASLEEIGRDSVFLTYSTVYRINYTFKELMHTNRRDDTSNLLKDLRSLLQSLIPHSMGWLAGALNWEVGEYAPLWNGTPRDT